jgi:hypothetical protein
MRRQARQDGGRLVLVPAVGGLGGLDVFFQPRGLGFTKREFLAALETREARRLYFRAWFMELPDHCVC